jgi:ABC-type dipeptide/oligopeptide/nickel transport system permease subunit
VLLLCLSLLFLTAVTVAGYLVRDAAMATDFSRKNLPPGSHHLFGTDWMGRDMFLRTMTGLSMSIRIGLLTATVSAGLAFLMGALAAFLGKAADSVVSWLIDLLMGIPHTLLLMLIAFACGRGFTGIVIGVVVTHWMSLARVIRSEILQLKESGYIKAAEKLGVSKRRIVTKHMAPHLLPQFMVGLILLFPHAILHEAGITFLGFGLSPEQPAIGIILSESMQHLAMGRWWLALFPGLLLVFTVVLFDLAGSCLRKLTDPGSAHE